MSIKFPPVILGPEMAAPILWAPGIFWFFLLENPHAHKIPPFRGGGFWVFLEGGGGSANFIFMGVGIFPIEALACLLPQTDMCWVRAASGALCREQSPPCQYADMASKVAMRWVFDPL